MQRTTTFHPASVLRRTLTALLLATAALLAAPGSAHAIGILVPRIPEVRPITLGDVEVRADIANNLARTRIIQDFRNPNPRDLEADFYFPVPRGANVTDFVLYMNGKPVPGEVLERDKARGIYEDIVRRMKDPGLLEWVDSNLFKVRVFPVPANGTQRIELEFAQPLEADQGLYRYLLPLKPPRGGEPARADAAVKFAVSIRSDEPLATVHSPTHTVETDMKDPRNVRVTMPGNRMTRTGDFILYYGHASRGVAVNLVATRTPPEDGFFTLMISPPADNASSATEEALDVTFVVDTSGSMLEDDKLGQARKALTYCVEQLRPGQRFNVVRFSTEVDRFRESLVDASPENLAAARRFIADFRATGGTNISGALTAALASTGETTGGRVHAVVLLTDGQPTVGVTSPDGILGELAKANRASLRVFTFGVGFDVNTRLLDGLADATRGAAEYTKPGQDIELPVSRFYDKISRPAMTGLKLSMPSAGVYDLYPANLPDLFHGSQLTVFGRFKNPGATAITLEGSVGGRPVRHTFEKTLPDSRPEDAHVEKLWGTRKIGFLLDEIRRNGENAETRDEVVRLARKYGVVTPYTSYLVVEDQPQPPVIGRPGPPRTSPVPVDDGRRTWGRDRAMVPADLPAPALARSEALTAQSGGDAVMASRMLSQLKGAVSQDAMEEGAVAAAPQVRTVAGRTFHLRDGVWVDTALDAPPAPDAPLPEIRIRYMSEAWFKAARLSTVLRDCLALGENVRIKLDRCVVVVGADGKQDLTPDDESVLK